MKREIKTGAKYLLQGLIVCTKCGYAYTGNTVSSKKYNYYRCTGTQTFANRKRTCHALNLRTSELEQAVWKEVTLLLNNTALVENECHAISV